MKTTYIYTALFLSIGSSLFALDTANFGVLIRSYGEQKRELSKAISQKDELEQKIATIKKTLDELAQKLGTSREELDEIKTGIEPENSVL